MNIFVETMSGSIDNLAEVLAEQGYTLSFYTTSIHTEVNGLTIGVEEAKL